MSTWIHVINGIITAISIKIIRIQISVSTKIGKIVRRNEPTCYRIVVSALKVIEVKVAIVVISAIPERIFRRSGASAAVMIGGISITIGTVRIGYKLNTRRAIYCNYISEQIFVILVNVGKPGFRIVLSDQLTYIRLCGGLSYQHRSNLL